MRACTVAVFLFGLASPAVAQLKDTDFTVPAKPGAFNDKTFTFPAAPKPSDKPASDKPACDKPPPPLWTGGAEFGVNGSNGNSDVLNVRLGGLAKRQTEANIFNADVNYNLSRNDSGTTANKAILNVRDEFLFRNSPWGLFTAGQVEYDEFRAFDFRFAGHSGVGYGFIREDWLTLRGRVGVGASREVGGPNDRWVPEGLFGADLFMAFSPRQGLITCADYYPDLGHFGQYRVRARAAYQVVLDPDTGLTLRVGAQDRFDSNPGPSKRNDVDFFTTLMIKF